MASIQQIKKIVDGFVAGDNESVIKILEQEAKKLRDSKRLTAYRDIKRLIAKIPSSKNKDLTAASVTPKIIPYGNTVSKSLVYERRSTVLPDSVVLNDNTKNSIATLFREWEFAEKLFQSGMNPTNRMIFYGPPGTGKTHLAHAVANQLDLPIMIVKLDELVSSHLGSTGKNIRDVFNLASERNIVLFLDEFDTLAKFRSDEKDLGELKRVVTVLLQHIDNFPPESVLIAATNHEDMLDKAVWRRFQLKVSIDLPDKNAVKKITKLYLKDISRIDTELVSEIFVGISGSDIKEICGSASRSVVLSGRDAIETSDLIESYLHFSQSHKVTENKKQVYELCQTLKNYGYTKKKISDISGVPYTTLRDNLK